MKLATTVTLSSQTGVTIDGVLLPWYVSDDVSVDYGREIITTVHLQLLVDGVVSIIDRDGNRKVIDGYIDQGLGDVGAFARELVRSRLADRVPWLGDVA